MYENLIIYSLIAFVLYIVIPREKKEDVVKQVKDNYAKYRLEMLLNGSKKCK